MTSPPFLPYGRQEIDDADVQAVVDALRHPLITQGPQVAEFEAAVGARLGAKHVIAVSSGTAALHCAAFAAGIGVGDEVLVPAITFAASANCARFMGADVRFVDLDPATLNMDAAVATAAVGPRTRAIVCVSFAGLPVDLGPLLELGQRPVIIEDGCHALGGHRNGVPVGGPGGADITCFSLHAVKAMTSGEGGLAVTQDDELARRMRIFRTHGITKDATHPEPWEGDWFYEMQALGFNYRITDVLCALGRSQLVRLDGWIERRNLVAAAYRLALADVRGLELPPSAATGDLHAYHLFVVRVLDGRERRRAVFEGLRAAGIGAQVHYIPVYRLPYYRDTLGARQDACPQAERYYEQCISLPMFPGMDDDDVQRVVTTIRQLL
jgi:perosamine synthetase